MERGSNLPRSSPSRSSLLTEPTRDDEGAGRRVELSRRSRESLAAHLGARRGGAVRRSVRGRRINGVSPPSPLPVSRSSWTSIILLFSCDVFNKTHLFQVFLSFKMIWFSHETIQNIELLINVKIENWPIKRCPEQGGAYQGQNSVAPSSHRPLQFFLEGLRVPLQTPLGGLFSTPPRPSCPY